MEWGYKREEIVFKNNGEKIYGVIYSPKDSKGKVPGIIFSHGFNGNNESGAFYAKTLAEKGYAVCCFDFRGGSCNSKSEGSSLNMSIFTEKSDLKVVIEMLQDFEFIDSNNIFLIGESQGGLVSAIIAAENKEIIRGMILIYPALCIVEDAKKRHENIENVPESEELMGLRIGQEYYKNLFDFNIYENILGYDKEVLIIHGDKDELVNISYSVEAVKKYKKAELSIIKDAGHGFCNGSEKEAVKHMINYMEKHKN
ncbi:hypothetical protein SAMN04487886_11186 [Clostridium sp. DSM 8431]|uniref:alpha/beta hydrolase family protein n=1 Tax=Clostridium sp. DSM 8431 TaxID=1761781 RepID=UPI0008EFB930|nr:alpha/beta fold hydrolase [Clostridium sp. DSM 8431]SFU72089.1 hypothetical protein SAMN04487886_11186 [Clostridium sp. DSM 8431]